MNLDDPILVEEFMEEAAQGLAKCHRTLVDESRTRIGTLVVKDADIVVECNITSSTRDIGVKLALQPDFFVGLAQSDFTALNKIQLKLHIVNVAESSPDAGVENKPARTQVENPAPPAVETEPAATGLKPIGTKKKVSKEGTPAIPKENEPGKKQSNAVALDVLHNLQLAVKGGNLPSSKDADAAGSSASSGNLEETLRGGISQLIARVKSRKRQTPKDSELLNDLYELQSALQTGDVASVFAQFIAFAHKNREFLNEL